MGSGQGRAGALTRGDRSGATLSGRDRPVRAQAAYQPSQEGSGAHCSGHRCPAFEPRPHGVKKLLGVDDLYRVRVGSYRVVYTIRDDRLIVLVLRISDRKDVYRGGP